MGDGKLDCHNSLRVGSDDINAPDSAMASHFEVQSIGIRDLGQGARTTGEPDAL